MIDNYSESNVSKIWAYFRGKGLNEYAIAGLLGNIYAESHISPNNLQNSCNKRLGLTDVQYTEAVDNGTYTAFVTDSAGYGLCQWTSGGRKMNLYNFCKGRGCSIGDLDMQLDFIWQELNSSYKNVLKALQSAETVDEAARVVILKYERPADQSEAAQLTRVGYGEEFYTKYANTEVVSMFDKIYNVLLGYVGYLEKASNANLEDKTANAGSKNYTIFAKLYKEYTGANFQGQAWCAMFVSVCFVLGVGLEKAKELLCGNLYAYCPYGMAAFKNKGQLYTTPKKGDVVFFLKNGVAKHIGFVWKVSGNTIYTIEGNTSGASGVVANGGGVFKKSYTVNSNMRFGRPNYDNVTGNYNPTTWVRSLQAAIGTTVDGIVGAKTLEACPTLKKGSKGEVVRLLQQKLGEQFKIAVSGGYDGDFGSGTVTAVKAFQKAQGLKADGVVGGKSWEKLLNYEKEETSKPAATDTSKEWVKELQAAIGAKVDGIAGSKTLAACPTLEKGDKGTVVKLMQQRLGEYFKIEVSGGYDGDFGAGTLAAVKEFQKDKGLKADGIVGKNTWRKLLCL